MQVLRVYHAGRDPAQRARERALTATHIDLTLVVPAEWPGPGAEESPVESGFRVIELATTRPGDVNRHSYRDEAAVRGLIAELKPDVLDIHEEPFSAAARQWLSAAPPDMRVVMYTAQNVDKRFPPPFAHYERAAHRRVAALYPCSAQAASVARGKGFGGLIEVLPLGHDPTLFAPGKQSPHDDEIVLALFGRLLPEKGATDAVRILARLNAVRPARLVVNGDGPEAAPARALAASLGVADRLELTPWLPAAELAANYRRAHIVLVPSLPTETWVEQFGRVIVEGQASGAVVAGYASGSIPEVAGEAAVLVDVGAVSELGDRIAQLVADPIDFARRRDQGIALSHTRTWAHVAERHAELYRRVASGEEHRVQLPRSPRERRAAARDEFGATASTTGGARPFALPLLRRPGAVPSALGAALDAVAELTARMGSRGNEAP